MDFNGEIVLITGAAGGIGKETARLFHEQGAKLVLVDLDKNALEKIAFELNLKDYLLFPADVRNEVDVKSFVQASVSKYGKIDVFFNNAGIVGRYGQVTEISTDDFEKVMSVNVKGVFYGLKHVLDVMIKQKSGSIVNTSSIAGLKGSPGLAPYSASKHAVIGLTKTAALEVGEDGIRVNAICPAPVNTQMMRSLDAIKYPNNPLRAKEEYEKRIPIKRYSEPNEIAELVLFLSSEKASYITGGCYQIDGGSSV
ncbi:oxidoreductase [Pueribacillus theae]|uniref:Oxidoreductase n=1 Tax=Pueribacillus theae TaxID=2171751 RepID=A0A2U1K5C1_9BACI|nr:SDR family oxidoreductase [Pueribacillus theae]PWA12158.1 oxidoreductase [Pueribacillus theae]